MPLSQGYEAQQRLNWLNEIHQSGHVDPMCVDFVDMLIAETERSLKEWSVKSMEGGEQTI